VPYLCYWSELIVPQSLQYPKNGSLTKEKGGRREVEEQFKRWVHRLDIKIMEAAFEEGGKSDLKSKKQRLIIGIAKKKIIREKTRY
jgi:hypothetical protein